MCAAKVLRWERRPDARPQELLDAALSVFAERGYRNTRLEEVAEAAGVTKGTIYHYFDTKEELLLRAIEHYHERGFGQLEALLADQQGPASARIRLFVRKGFGGGDPVRRKQLLRLMQGVAHEVPEVYSQWVATGPFKGSQLLARLVEEGQATGEFRNDVDSDVASRLLTSGLVLQLIWQQQCDNIPDFAIDDDRLLDSTVEFFLHGLRPVVAVAPTVRR
ncbi:MAG: TetR/AcrR family transcriptional regulator [bacterium]